MTRAWRPWPRRPPREVRTYGLRPEADRPRRRDRVAGPGRHRLHPARRRGGRRRVRSAMPGRHLVPHALAAAAVAERFEVPLDEVEAALAAGSHADHRMAVVTAASGATLIDDTYNASPVSVAAALDFLGETPARARAAALRRAGRHAGARSGRGAPAPGDRCQGRRHRGRPAGGGGARSLDRRGGPRRPAWPAWTPPRTSDEAVAAFDRSIPATAGDLVLVKGSRGVELDRLVDALGASTVISIVVALLLAFTGVLLLGPLYIGLLQRLGFGKRIRTDGPESHQVKAGTPTMGGMLHGAGGHVPGHGHAHRGQRHPDADAGAGGRRHPGRDRRLRERPHRGRHARPLEADLADGGGAAGRVLRPAPLQHHRAERPVPGRGRGRGALLRPVHGLRDRGRQQRREPDRWAGRPGGRRPDLQLRGLPADRAVRSARAAGPAAQPGDLLRPGHRRPDGLPVVQRPPGADLHGRLRVAGPGRDAGRGRHPEPAAAAARDHRHRLLRRDHERGPAGRLVPPAWAAHLPHARRCSTTSS